MVLLYKFHYISRYNDKFVFALIALACKSVMVGINNDNMP